MQIREPIFIVGVGRSGSTVFFKLLAEHPSLAWFPSGIIDRHPDKPWLSRRILKAVDLPFIGRKIRSRYTPGEGYNFWDRCYRGFSTPCRDLVAGDVTNRIKSTVPQALSEFLTPKRNRLALKITGWPRIGFLHEIFPDARFIHVKRDAAAVINSMLNVHFWEGWRGPQNWRWGELTPAQRKEWERFDRSFVALAGIQMQILAEAMDTARASIPQQSFMEISYEALCADPLGTYARVFDFCGIKPIPNLTKIVAAYRLENRNMKWQQELTETQKEIVEHFRTPPPVRP